MSAGTYNAYIEQGATWAITLTLFGAGAVPMDLTGYTGASQIRASASAAAALAAPTVTFVEPRTAGVVVLSLTATQTKALAAAGLRFQETTNAIWEFDITAPDGTVYRVLNGDAAISPGGIKP